MQIVGLDKISAFVTEYPDSKASLESWVAHVKSVEWKTPADVKQSYRFADILKNKRVIFNIQHKKYRLIAVINYPYQVVVVCFLGTHKQYDDIDAETVQCIK